MSPWGCEDSCSTLTEWCATALGEMEFAADTRLNLEHLRQNDKISYSKKNGSFACQDGQDGQSELTKLV